MKLDIMGAVQPTQNLLDNQLRDTQQSRAAGGILQGLQSLGNFKRGRDQTRDLQNSLNSLILDYDQASEAEGLDPMLKLGLKDKMTNLTLLGKTTNPGNIDTFGDRYAKMFSPQEDMLKLANELRKAELTGQYGLDKAEISGQYSVDAAREYAAGKNAGVNDQDLIRMLQAEEEEKRKNSLSGLLMNGLTGLFGGQ